MENAIVRSLDELGRVILPKEYRLTLGMESKTLISITCDKENQPITLKKYEPSCICCHETEDLKAFPNNVYLCKKCLASADGVK